MSVLALDLSTHAGWAVFGTPKVAGGVPKLIDYGVIENTVDLEGLGYPWTVYSTAMDIASQVQGKIDEYTPEIIVIEQINLGRNRYAQQLLERIHSFVLLKIFTSVDSIATYYIDSSEWRKTVGLRLNKDQKKANAKLSKAKRSAIETGSKLDKKALGIRGRVTWKHLSIMKANEVFSVSTKDDNKADALLLGLAYFLGAKPCTGKGQ